MPHSQNTLQVGITKGRDPVWSTDGGPPFTMPDGSEMARLNWLQRLDLGRWSYYRRFEAPHLSYSQVATANQKSRAILKALRKGPIYLVNGFLKSRDNRVITTRAISHILVHWMEQCGFVFEREVLSKHKTKLDIDIEASIANGAVDDPREK